MVRQNGRVIQIVGEHNANTCLGLSHDYAETLKTNRVNATRLQAEGIGHIRIEASTTFKMPLTQEQKIDVSGFPSLNLHN